jgi:pimeloyl-ACP methyl ester carboxylesterase
VKRTLLLLALVLAGCATRPAIPEGIVKETHQVGIGRERLAVDFYYRPGRGPRPLAVAVHGFLANRGRMGNWGVMLAEAGFVAAVPSQPTPANDKRNIAAVVGLVEAGRAGHWPVPVRSDGRIVLVGFSRGGFETLSAAAGLGDGVRAWIGLDPVDRDGRGAAIASQVNIPGLALLAEPSALNARGNAWSMLADYAGPLRLKTIAGSGHLDAESPRNEIFEKFRREVRQFLLEVVGP